ncbi:PRC-barrel domain-containing protein [Fluoribacter dumoffii]|uniref:PRC-barrel domain n=1 Tax=Fluoribacter dumoffii TaxID=463 RepID=A0A377GAC8_9GAMM|nr:PRC-barrel domain-containing protein [Fluoribacter dumoffii]KTC88735.1 PRC-barrel domain protein [Fluoribacter dumoffii NY 23]MCW8385971.1 PRC-barrel domain-containing protein [Fluoribacter dumoffii]MCW8419023.1 PRC-barrel domain-containing protein [Fluoribacter dumoffii]MCW8453133.1 PRC-barrel domain-containing protein [Fluoribacter dumoffii]MCW8459649.1 PRC-barrel domain-containing protein [Fluoribacter dumoffii]
MNNPEIVKSDDVKGKEVKSPNMESLGEIEEIVLDKVSGQAKYVVLSFGGFLGMGEKYFAFPWKSIHYNDNEDCFILNVDKSQLKQEYGFDKNNWPDMASWPTTIDRYYH